MVEQADTPARGAGSESYAGSSPAVSTISKRRLGLPDASVLVLQGIIFVFVLASDALYGRIGFLKGKS